MRKFTPGPWEAGSNPKGIGSNDWVVRPRGEFPHGEWIADVGYGSTDPERRANARLIAAAPEMCDALLAFLEIGDCKASRDMAKAALAKAAVKPTRSPAPDQPATRQEPS
jgi:hypothetical protein